MEQEYVQVNRNTYDELAKEYRDRNYAVQDDFYLNIMFKDMDFSNGKKILEIGPGRGDRLKNFVDYGLDVTAIELSSEMSQVAAAREPKAKIINANVFECNFDEPFDFIYMEAVIHNFPLEEAKRLLKLVSSWLKDDGTIICTTTVEDADYEGYESKDDYRKPLERFRHRYTEETFDDLFISQGLKIVQKKFKKETDEIRSKMWQIGYLKKDN